MKNRFEELIVAYVVVLSRDEGVNLWYTSLE